MRQFCLWIRNITLFSVLEGESGGAMGTLCTASGGPFRQIQGTDAVSDPPQALQHPNWKMGPKVTIDSATLMNKGLELIEAKWLFGLPADKIKAVIHPQSVVYGLVNFQMAVVLRIWGQLICGFQYHMQ